jgi:hypothetical protein
MQSLNKTQQFISSLSKKSTVAQPVATANTVLVDEITEQPQNIIHGQQAVAVEDSKEAAQEFIVNQDEEDVIMHEEEEKVEVA